MCVFEIPIVVYYKEHYSLIASYKIYKVTKCKLKIQLCCRLVPAEAIYEI